MKEIFSKTWVVALMVGAVLVLVAYVAFGKKDKETPALEEGDKTKKGK